MNNNEILNFFISNKGISKDEMKRRISQKFGVDINSVEKQWNSMSKEQQDGEINKVTTQMGIPYQKPDSNGSNGNNGGRFNY